MPGNWPKIEELYHAALAKAAAERGAFLDEACAGDEDLRREVLSLLGYEPQAERPMEQPASWVADGCTTAVEHKGIGLAFFSWDMRLSKTFKVTRKGSIELLFEVFNITNHVNFDRDSYVVAFSSPNFGHATDIVKNSQRQAEGGVRFRF